MISWHNIGSSLVELTLDHRVAWQVVTSAVSGRRSWRAPVGQFVLILEEDELKVRYGDRTHTIACNRSLRERLCRLVEQHVDTDAASVAKHLGAVLLQMR